MCSMTELEILKIKNLNALVIRTKRGRFFTTSPNSIIISIPNLVILLNSLVKFGYISEKVLEGILDGVVE